MIEVDLLDVAAPVLRELQNAHSRCKNISRLAMWFLQTLVGLRLISNVQAELRLAAVSSPVILEISYQLGPSNWEAHFLSRPAKLCPRSGRSTERLLSQSWIVAELALLLVAHIKTSKCPSKQVVSRATIRPHSSAVAGFS